MTQEIFYLSAVELTEAIRAGRLSAREVMQAHLARIEQVNPKVNAIVTLHAEQALAAAAAADEAQAQGKPLGALHGLPVAHKDLLATSGMRTTFGSKVHEHNVPKYSVLIVERQQQAGAISIGKTNTPEFGAGSQTFNAVFGATRNPYDLGMTCGGSSGGSAVALATGMVALADGTDMGGSLRCPANYCNIVGLRPSVGRVPQVPAIDAWDTLSVSGPMARTVEDLALYLSVIAGPDARDPLAIAEDGTRFRASLKQDMKGARIAFAPTMGGLPVDRRVIAAIEAQRKVFEDLGCVVEDAWPDMRDAHEIFMTLRAHAFESRLGAVMDQHPGVLKDTVVWNIEEGRKLTGPKLARAAKLRTALFKRMNEFMQRYDFLVLPVNQVPPFSIEQAYITEIDGVKMESYIDWMRSCYLITATGHPALSVPCAFTDDGLPVGLQIVGRHQGEMALLRMGFAFEQATGVGQRRPAGL
ncbi:amidase [Noviherbaspirillum sp. CPCC 100848]|uniref:Amidase n=1 Tax=Noviherbaspirillum album TaxID=3080276 RepID=A0ABU6J387_9BURK|nr:amidase [Noviherbaspirillum sp. CPCC 100848]MEC4717891.1 amidase [Noviherbaspirillum sp. CPCC 100848]